MEICSSLVEKEKEKTTLLYRLPLRRFLFADTVEKFPRLNEPRGSCRRDVSIMRSSQIYAKKKNDGKNEREPCSKLLCATKNTAVLEYVSFGDVDRIFRLVVEIEHLSMRLGNAACTNTMPLFYCPTRDNETDI